MTLNIILSMDCVSIKVEKLEICFVEFDNCHGGKWLIYIGITTNIAKRDIISSLCFGISGQEKFRIEDMLHRVW